MSTGDKASEAESLFQAALDAAEEQGPEQAPQLKRLRELGLRGTISYVLSVLGSPEVLGIRMTMAPDVVYMMGSTLPQRYLEEQAARRFVDLLIQRGHMKFTQHASGPSVTATLVLGVRRE